MYSDHETYKGYDIEIVQDQDSESPADWGNYTLAMAPSLHLINGDKEWSDYVDDDGMPTDETMTKLESGKVWPISYSSHGPQCLYQLAYDSSDADGFIEFEDDYIKGVSKDARKKYAEQALETYSQWANGETYGYHLTSPYKDDFDDDSCYGFYGYDSVVQSAHEAIDYDIAHDTPSMHSVKASEVHN
jgi:hypothetical protein